jgi:hypothetical protein
LIPTRSKLPERKTNSFTRIAPAASGGGLSGEDDMTQPTTYPAWQTKIREAQRIHDALRRDRDEEEAYKAEAKRQREINNLNMALAQLGIAADATAPIWERDGYHFSLYTDYGLHIDYPNHQPFHRGKHRDVVGESDYFWFTLRVQNVGEWNEYRLIKANAVAFDDIDGWMKLRDELARALDELSSFRPQSPPMTQRRIAMKDHFYAVIQHDSIGWEVDIYEHNPENEDDHNDDHLWGMPAKSEADAGLMIVAFQAGLDFAPMPSPLEPAGVQRLELDEAFFALLVPDDGWTVNVWQVQAGDEDDECIWTSEPYPTLKEAQGAAKGFLAAWLTIKG